MKYMKNKLFITLVFTLTGVLFFAENLNAQKLISGGRPKDAAIENYAETSCVALPKGFRVCKARDESEESEIKFIIQKNLKTVKTMDAPFFSGSTAADFRAYWGDLDKNGSPEIVIASLENVSNGLGVPHFYIHIFRDSLKLDFQKVLTFPIEEFGEKGNFIYDARRNETQILVTRWVERNNIDTNRGNGMYLIGTWFRYRNGLLEPIFDKPTLAKRLLYNFVRERNVWNSGNQNAPYVWLQSKNTHKLKRNPPPVDRKISTQTETVKKYEQIADEYDPIAERRIAARLDSGELVNCRFYTPSGGYAKAAEQNQDDKIISDFGFADHDFLVPFDFEFQAIFQKVEGKRIRLDTYQDASDNVYTQLWFLER